MKIYREQIIIILLTLFSGACTNIPSIYGNDSLEGKSLPEYVSISPISLPPIAPDIKSGLHEIAENVAGADQIPYDMDLLVLPTTLSKVQYDFFNINMSGTGGGIATGSVNEDRSKAVYDLMHMASHPLPVVITPIEEGKEKTTIIVTPFVGVGVRVIAEYELNGGKGNLSLPALAAAIEKNDGSGSIEIQQLGISRYGNSNQGVTGVDLTPDNLEAALKSIGYMMGQIWLKDTRVQPMIIGYSVPGYSNIDATYHPYIVDQLISRKKEIMQPFIESMFFEAQEVFGISGTLKGKNGDNTDYNAKLASLKSSIQNDRKIADRHTKIALEKPNNLLALNPILFASTIKNTIDREIKEKEKEISEEEIEKTALSNLPTSTSK